MLAQEKESFWGRETGSSLCWYCVVEIKYLNLNSFILGIQVKRSVNYEGSCVCVCVRVAVVLSSVWHKATRGGQREWRERTEREREPLSLRDREGERELKRQTQRSDGQRDRETERVSE